VVKSFLAPGTGGSCEAFTPAARARRIQPPVDAGKVNCVSALRNISLLKKFEAKLVFSTPKFVYLFFFWVFFLNIGRSVTGLFVVAKGLLFMTS